MKDPCEELRTNIYLCDEEGCCQQAVVVLPDYCKCDEHDKEQQLTELLRAARKKKEKILDDTEKSCYIIRVRNRGVNHVRQ